jgi:hypothetical protein
MWVAKPLDNPPTQNPGVVTQVVSNTTKLATGCGLVIAVLMLAGTGLAQSADAVGEAGGQAQAMAEGNYHADASGAMNAANEEQQSAREEAAGHVRNSGDAYQKAYADASAETQTDVDRPECDCQQAVAQVEQQGHGQLETAHEAEQAADVDNEYVDAGAEADASAQAQAWYHELFQGVGDAIAEVGDLLEQDTQAREDVNAHVEQSMDTESQAREDVASTLASNQSVASPVEPSTEGAVAGEQTASAATSTVTEASAP